jgi:hypothetical protein
MMAAMLTSEARVPSQKPQRYLALLTKHFGHHNKVERNERDGALFFEYGTCRIVLEPGFLVLKAEAGTEENLARLERVAGGHAERFGFAEELKVVWTRG